MNGINRIRHPSQTKEGMGRDESEHWKYHAYDRHGVLPYYLTCDDQRGCSYFIFFPEKGTCTGLLTES